jgi:hypothetical protein
MTHPGAVFQNLSINPIIQFQRAVPPEVEEV